MKTRHHMALSVDVDRFDDRYMTKHYTNVLRASDGHYLTIPEIRIACFDHRSKGFEVFPPCDHHDEKGYCKGHPIEEGEAS